MADVSLQDLNSLYSGKLQLLEQGRTWTEYWAVLEHAALRLYASEEYFKAGSEEVRLIPLSQHFQYEPLHRSSYSYHFRLCVDSSIYHFKCASVFVRQQWLGRLKYVSQSFCRKSCFHCYKSDCETNRKSSDHRESVNISIQGSSEVTFESEQEDSLASEENTNDIHSPNDTGTVSEYQVTSPLLKLFHSQENLVSSFTTGLKERKVRSKTESKNGYFTLQDSKHRSSSSEPEDTSANEHENSMVFENSSGIPSIDGDPEFVDRVTTSPLKIFDPQDHHFSTFLIKSNKGKTPPKPGFVNPVYISEDSDSSPKISKRLSKQFGESKSFVACDPLL